MLLKHWRVTLELMTGAEEGVRASVFPDGVSNRAVLKVDAELPDELLDWVCVHSLARCLLQPMEAVALDAAATVSEEQRGIWSGRLDRASEKLAQRLTDMVLRRDHTFLVDAWFAMMLYEE